MANAVEGRVATYGGARIGERRVCARRSERVVLECECGESLFLIGPVDVRSSGHVVECACGERFTFAGRMADRDHDVFGHWEARSPEEERRYSWLEDCLERLEGKEARQEYYVRLGEQAVSW